MACTFAMSFITCCTYLPRARPQPPVTMTSEGKLGAFECWWRELGRAGACRHATFVVWLSRAHVRTPQTSLD